MDANKPFVEQSSYLKLLQGVIDKILDFHALQFQATSSFYQQVLASPKKISFPLPDGSEWKAPMPKQQALGYAPMLTSVAAVHSLVMLAGALDYYLYKTCQSMLPKHDIIDRTWFNLAMLQPITGVNPANCLRWTDVDDLMALWHKFVYPEDYDLDPLIQANRLVLTDKASAVRMWAIDWERAIIIQNPRLKLP